MKLALVSRSPTWPMAVVAACGFLATSLAGAAAADYAPYGWAPPGPPPAYAPRYRRRAEIAVVVAEPVTQFDDPTAAFAEALDLQPAPPAPDVIARRERALPVGVIYNVPTDPFLARRRYSPVIRANY